MRRLTLAFLVGLTLALASTVGAAGTPRHNLASTSDENLNSVIKRLDQIIPVTKAGRPTWNAIYCGQLSVASPGPTFFGSTFADITNGGEGFASDAGGATCNAMDNATESTAGTGGAATPYLFKNIDAYVTGMYCRAVTDSGTTGSGANGATFTFRVNGAATTPALSCTVPTGAVDCYATIDTDANLIKVGAGVASALKVDYSEDLSANDGWCRVFFVLP